jgi:hypothetical protein
VTVLDSGDVDAQESSAFLDVALRYVFLLSQDPQSFAYIQVGLPLVFLAQSLRQNIVRGFSLVHTKRPATKG